MTTDKDHPEKPSRPQREPRSVLPDQDLIDAELELSQARSAKAHEIADTFEAKIRELVEQERQSAVSAPREVTSLPFVLDHAPTKSRGKTKRDFWHVQPTGQYSSDCRTGAHFGIEYLRFLQARADDKDRTSGFLLSIVKAMAPGLIGHGHSGIEVGFFETVDYAARFGLLPAERLQEHYDEFYRGIGVKPPEPPTETGDAR